MTDHNERRVGEKDRRLNRYIVLPIHRTPSRSGLYERRTAQPNAVAQDSRIEQGQDVSQAVSEPVAAAPTPITDLNIVQHQVAGVWQDYVHAHVARQLEWELAALNDKYLTVKLAWKLRSDELTRAEAALAAANAKLAEFEQDAMRYRWLRSCDVECGVLSELARRGRCEELFDAAIDAARKGESQ